MAPVSDIKLIKQILHFDLSQKAEKRYLANQISSIYVTKILVYFDKVLLQSLSETPQTKYVSQK